MSASSPASLRTILPLAAITCASMLAMDLYLPAVPAMQHGLGLTVPQGQATIAIFLAGLAASQLLWGEALPRIGPKACVKWGLVLLILASLGCAAAQSIDVLLLMRLVQGMAAGAATVVAPAVIRATLPAHDGVRGMAAIGMIEAIIPAAGPVLGTVMLMVVDWRWTFVVVGLMALAAMPMAMRAAPRVLPNLDTTVRTGYLALLRSGRFVRLAVAHALCFAALLTFVASAPQMLHHGFGLGGEAFALSQVFGVSGFAGMAALSGRLSARWGSARAIQISAWAHALWCAGFAALAAAGWVNYAVLVVFWTGFCGIFGLRSPAAFSDTLSVPVAQMGRAAALLMLALLVVSSASAQAVAPFLAQTGLLAVGGAMAALCIVSLLLVLRYPK